MPKLPGPIRSKSYTEATFQPYAVAIGRLVLGWNALHEDLANIFCRLMGSDGDDARSLAVWHAVQFDRPKRVMFRGALEAEKDRKDADIVRLDDVIWLLNQTDELENARNDAVHSPLLLLGYRPDANYSALSGWIIPDAFNKNPRALRLKGKDVLEYFRWIAKAIAALRVFAAAVESAWDGSKPWPDRPSLPARSAKRKTPWERYWVQKR